MFESIFSGLRIKIHCIFRYNFHHPMPIPIEVDYIFHVSYFPKKKYDLVIEMPFVKFIFIFAPFFALFMKAFYFLSPHLVVWHAFGDRLFTSTFSKNIFFSQSQLKMSFFESLAFTRIISRKETIRLSL